MRYTDRFGHCWSVSYNRVGDAGWSLVFADGGIRLVNIEPVATHPGALSEAELKEMFCDAERVLVCDDETWYVGYRRRATGGRGRSHAGLATRFRSEAEDVRYSRQMLDFRHMSTGQLREHLEAARGNARKK